MSLPRMWIVNGYVPKARRVHTIFTCAMIGHCHECDEIPRPCSEDCRLFGPCKSCLSQKLRMSCGDSRCTVDYCVEIRRQEYAEWAVRTF